MSRLLAVSAFVLTASGVMAGVASATPVNSVTCTQPTAITAAAASWCWCHGYRPCWQCR